MAKFFGEVGYAIQEETAPGVWSEVIAKRNYTGDVIKNVKRFQDGENLNDELNVSNVISIIADPFAYENFFAIRYLRWMGANWKVTGVEVQRPRLILTIGGVYIEPTDTTAKSP